MRATPHGAAGADDPDTRNNLGVVVGIDGSENSHVALQAAAQEAARRELPLTLLTTYSLSPYSKSSEEAGNRLADESTLQRLGREKLNHARQAYLGDHRGEIHELVKFGDPTTVLKDHSHRAQLLVVGTRGLGGFVGRLAGSVSAALPEYSACPIMIVPREHTSEAQPPEKPSAAITVGLDGSERSLSAALAAAEEAQRRGQSLRLVRALPSASSLFSWRPGAEERRSIETTLNTELDGDRDWLSSHYPDLEITTEVLDGTSVDVLAEESGSTGLIVIGTTGRGGFVGRLLGSTSQGLIREAKTPILLVPQAGDRRLRTRTDFPGSD